MLVDEPSWEGSPGGLEVTGAFPGVGSGEIRELAAWGARIVVSARPPWAIGDCTPFELRSPDRVVVACTVRLMGLVEFDIGYELTLWVCESRPSWREAIEAVAVRSSLGRASRPLLPSTKLLRERIPARIRALAADNARATVRSLGNPHSPALPARLDPEGGLLLEWHPAWSEMTAPFEIQVEGPFSSVKFRGNSLASDAVLQPTDATVIRRRLMRRVGVPAGAKLILRGIGGDDSPIELKMRDVSLGGVSAALDERVGDDLHPGTEVPEVVLTWRGGPGLRFSGEIRHRSPGPRRDGEVLGLQLLGGPGDQRERWTREVENLLYPSTRSYGYDFQLIWDLYEDSGYFDLSESNRKTSDFRQLRSSFEVAYRKISEAPDLGCLACYESPSRIEATMTGLRAWSRSWLGMHLARDPVRPHLVKSDSSPLKDIHFHVFERAGANPDINWILIFVRDDAPAFSAGLYRELILSVPGACGVPFEAWKFGVSMRGDFCTPHVGTASRAQVDAFLEVVAVQRPAAYLDAHDLLPETFYQEEFTEQWRSHGLVRERTLLVATEDGHAKAAALLEMVDDGLHLYGLLDTARLYELAPGGRAYYDELLVAANEWFYSMGKSYFVCFDEDALPELMESAGATSLGKAVIAYLPRNATPEMLERVAEITAPKL